MTSETIVQVEKLKIESMLCWYIYIRHNIDHSEWKNWDSVTFFNKIQGMLLLLSWDLESQVSMLLENRNLRTIKITAWVLIKRPGWISNSPLLMSVCRKYYYLYHDSRSCTQQEVFFRGKIPVQDSKFLLAWKPRANNLAPTLCLTLSSWLVA